MLRTKGDTLINGILAGLTNYLLDLSAIDRLALQAVYSNATTAAKTFTVVNTTTDTATITAHGQSTGSLGQLTSSGTLPTGLSLATNYFIIVVDANTVKFATSLVNAQAGTAVDITGAGSGTQTFTPTASSGNILKLQASNDGLNFTDISGDTVTIATTSGNVVWDLQTPGYRYVNILYTPAAGQVSVKVVLNGKSDK